MISIANKKRKTTIVDKKTFQIIDVKISDRTIAKIFDSFDVSKLFLTRLSNNFVENEYTDFFFIFVKNYK